MKPSLVVSLALTAGVASALSTLPVPNTAASSKTQLHLFGGGDKKKEGGGPGVGGGGMMDQLAMFKKAQEVAQKKKKLDEELAALDFEGVGADGKVKATFKFVPVQNPMDPNPDYEAKSFEFDDDWYESASPEDLSAAVKEAIQTGSQATANAMAEKYQELQKDMMGMLGQGAPPPVEEEKK